MPKNYKKTSPEKKLSILKSHLLDNKPVSELSEENEVSPSNYYQWQKQLFDQGLESFDTKRKRKGLTNDQKEVRRLEAELAAAKAKLSARDEVVAELMQEHIHLKKDTWGALNKQWVEPDIRDEVVDYVSYWQGKTGYAKSYFIKRLGIHKSKFYSWSSRQGEPNKHNAPIPRHNWLLEWEQQAIINYFQTHPFEGYRRLSYMMLDDGVVAVSPSSVYRVLHSEGLLEKNNTKPSLKGTGFVQPLKPHDHWHTGISYVNISGTFYYLCSVLDGCSRAILSWDIKASMTESDVEIVIQKAKETYPNQSPRVISDNGPQFIAKDFKEFIRLSGMSHVRTSPYYPQSNGKIERWHKTLKVTCIRPKQFETLDEVKQGVSDFIHHYNDTRLHSALGYVAPITKLKGEDKGVFELRDRQLAEALAARKKARSKAA